MTLVQIRSLRRGHGNTHWEGDVTAPLLTTKLRIPPLRQETVPRPRLVEQLNRGLQGKLTLISAPAGFGKSTLLIDWVATSDRPVAWLSLDKGDNDPVRFLAYLLAALQRIDPCLGQSSRAMLQSPQTPPLEQLLTTVINDVADSAQPFILVLDDYHVIEAEPVHTALTFVLDQLPSEMHLVIATRADPPLPIARLRGLGELSALYQADLRFTPSEVTAFLNGVMALNLSEEDIAVLEQRTEGWIAGLQMAAVSMQGREDIARLVQAFAGSHRYIIDYLAEEVLRQQPPGVRDFLLQTAILDRLTASLCEAVLAGTEQEGEVGDAQAMLEYLDRNNLFVLALDDERRWYRYHRLFGDLLQQRLMRERSDLLPSLHRRASEWYEGSGLIEQAVDHALAASDYGQAATLLERTGWEMAMRGACATLLSWLDAFPATYEPSRPQLAILRAWCLVVTGQAGTAEAQLVEIGDERFQGEIAAVRAYASSIRGDARQGIAFAQQALENLPEDNPFLRGIVALNLGIAHFSGGEPIPAGRALEQAVELSQPAGFPDLRLAAMAVLGHVKDSQALLREAIGIHRDVLELAKTMNAHQAPAAGMAHLGIAEVLYEWNDVPGAARHTEEAIGLLERGRFMAYLLFGHSLRVRIHCAEGDLVGAQGALERAEQLARGTDLAYMAAELSGLRARLLLAQGQTELAARWAADYGRNPTDEFDRAREVEQMAVSRVLIALADPGAALSLLRPLQQAAEAAGRRWHVIRILALRALATAAQDDLNGALAALDEALSLAETEGFVRSFVDEGEPIAKLLRRALSRSSVPSYAARLLAAFDKEPQPNRFSQDILVEPLTAREMDVLRLIVAGLSNPEIADELFIAISTVKSHVNHIYGKLGVSNRVEAVTQAQALGLV